MFETPKCNICGSSEFEVIKEEVAKGNPSKLVICKECGLAFLSPRWNKDGYTEYYKKSYDNSYRPDISSFDEFSKLNEKNPICERFLHGEYLKDNFSRVLDIGSGEGKNLFFISKYVKSPELFAIEPSEISQKILRKNEVNFVSDDVDSGWEKDYKESFDVIIMRHVLEHFLDPLEALKRIRTTLSEDGILYIAVPNNLKKNRLNGWARIPHTYYFNKYSLGNIMSLAGYKILEMKEGDSFNKHEIFLFVRKNTDTAENPQFNRLHFEEQRAAFQEVLKKERSLLYKFKKLARAVKKS